MFLYFCLKFSGSMYGLSFVCWMDSYISIIGFCFFQVSHLTSNVWSLLASSLRMVVLCLITTFRRNRLSILFCVCEEVPKSARRRITPPQRKTSIKRRRLSLLFWNTTRYFSSFAHTQNACFYIVWKNWAGPYFIYILLLKWCDDHMIPEFPWNELITLSFVSNLIVVKA